MRRIGVVASILLAALPALAAAQEGGIRLSPVRLYLAADENATAVTVTNQDAAERRFQVQVERWNQSPDAVDELTPTQDVIANPPMFALKSGQSRIVRVGFVDASASQLEQAYRVYIREVPASQVPGVDGEPQAASGIQILRRFSLPLFRAPAGPVRHELQWSASRNADSLTLRAHNRGNVHERRSDLKAYGDAGGDAEKALIEHVGGVNDMLPGTTRTWTFRTSRAGDKRLRLESISDRQSTTLVEYVAVP